MQLRTYFGGVATIENCNYHLTTLFGTQTLPGENFKIDVTCELVSHVQPLIRHWESLGFRGYQRHYVLAKTNQERGRASLKTRDYCDVFITIQEPCVRKGQAQTRARFCGDDAVKYPR